MQIIIKYESSWRNSFLDGSNNEPLPKVGRGFLGSITQLKKNKENFISRRVSHDTVMGVLNRLIGEQRKLYQARIDGKYYFQELDKEEVIKFKNIENASSEMVYIRNFTGSTDQNSFSGMIKGSDPIFNSKYSKQLWGVLFLDFQDLCNFINNPTFSINTNIDFDPLSIVNRFECLSKLKIIETFDAVQMAILELKNRNPDINYFDDKEKVKPLAVYCSAFYLQIFRLSEKFDLSNSLTKKGLVSGIARSGSFTIKDFMDRFTTGNKKIVWGNPYLLKEKRKGEGEVSSLLTKASGALEIQIDIPKEKALQLKEMIENAGVSSFYLGKKGLAFVEEIII